MSADGGDKAWTPEMAEAYERLNAIAERICGDKGITPAELGELLAEATVRKKPLYRRFISWLLVRM